MRRSFDSLCRVCPIANRPIPPGMFRVIYDRILDYDAIQRELIYLWRISLLPYPPASLALPNDVLDDEHEVGFEYPGSRDSQKTLRQVRSLWWAFRLPNVESPPHVDTWP